MFAHVIQLGLLHELLVVLCLNERFKYLVRILRLSLFFFLSILTISFLDAPLSLRGSLRFFAVDGAGVFHCPCSSFF